MFSYIETHSILDLKNCKASCNKHPFTGQITGEFEVLTGKSIAWDSWENFGIISVLGRTYLRMQFHCVYYYRS